MIRRLLSAVSSSRGQGTDLVRPHTCLPATFHSWKPFHCRSRRPNPTISPECPSEKIRLDPTNSEYATRVPFWSRIFSRKFGCRDCRRLVPQTGIRLAGTRSPTPLFRENQGFTRRYKASPGLRSSPRTGLGGKVEGLCPHSEAVGQGNPPDSQLSALNSRFSVPVKEANQSFTSLYKPSPSSRFLPASLFCIVR